MEKTILIFIILSFCLSVFSQIDTPTNTQLENKILLLEDQIQLVKQGQLNYSIEKDIYKEVFQNHYNTYNLVITIVIGVFGLLTFLGFRNINSIKNEYSQELDNLKLIKGNFENKISDFENLKAKYDEEIEKINSENKSQQIKIQILELKEKIRKYEEDEDFILALETITVAVEIMPNDNNLRIDKSRIECKLGSYKNAINTLVSLKELNIELDNVIPNLTELYYFNNQIDKAEKLLEEFPDSFDSDNHSKLIPYFKTIEAYHNKSKNELQNIIENQVDKSKLNTKSELCNWDFEDAHWFHTYTKYPEKENLFLNYVWYIKGENTGNELLSAMKNDS